MTLLEEIRIAINRCNAESGSNTPDYLLAEFLCNCLAAFNATVAAKEASIRLSKPRCSNCKHFTPYTADDIGYGRPPNRGECGQMACADGVERSSFPGVVFGSDDNWGAGADVPSTFGCVLFEEAMQENDSGGPPLGKEECP